MEEKHSRLGIASFVLSLVIGLSLFVLFAVAGLLNGGRVERGGHYPGQALVGVLAIALFAADVVAAGLGIASVCQSARKRIFGILGLSFSALTLVGSVGLMIIGIIFVAAHAH